MPVLSVASLHQDVGGNGGNTGDLVGRDANYQRIGMFGRIPQEGEWYFGEPASDILWVHWRQRTSNGATSSAADGIYTVFYNDDNQIIGVIDVNNGSMFAQARGDNTGNGASFSAGPNGAVRTYDVKFDRVASPGNTIMELYRDGVLVSAGTAIETAGRKMPSRMNMRNNDIDASDGQIAYFNEMIAMDNESTIGMRLATLEADSDGNYTQWNGGAAELFNTGTVAMAASDTVGQRHSSVASAYNGATTGSIRAVVAKARTRNGGGVGPGSITQFLRIGGTDYDGTPVACAPGEITQALEVWDNNPNTSLPWVAADLTGIEYGLLSSA